MKSLPKSAIPGGRKKYDRTMSRKMTQDVLHNNFGESEHPNTQPVSEMVDGADQTGDDNQQSSPSKNGIQPNNNKYDTNSQDSVDKSQKTGNRPIDREQIDEFKKMNVDDQMKYLESIGQN